MAMEEVPVLATKLAALHEDVSEIRSAVAKLVVIEERQTQTSSAIERIFKAIAKLEDRVSAIERSMPMTGQATRWVYNAAWMLSGVAIMFILKRVGIM